MAIRIDLLPRYVGLRRVFKRILVACLALVAVFASVLFVIYYHGEQELATLRTNEQTFKVIADAANKADEEAKAKEADSVPYKAVVDFVADASKTGAERAVLLDQIKDYIYRDADITSMDVSDGKTVKFAGSVRDIDGYYRFVLGLRQGSAPEGPLFSDLPGGPGIPPYPTVLQTPVEPTGLPGTLVAQVFPVGVTSAGTLQHPVIIPIEPGAAVAPAGPGGGPPMGPGGGPPMGPGKAG